MKKTYLSAILFIVVILFIAAGVYVKWEQSQEQTVSQASKTSTYVEPVGSYVNPFPYLSGKTYEETDMTYGISMQIPVEFKESVARNTLVSNSVYLQGYRNKVIDQYSGSEIKLSPTYAMSFSLTEKSKIRPIGDRYKYEIEIYPALNNLNVGQSYTYSKYTNQEKLEIFGENYQNLNFMSDEVYTRLPDINEWRVYKFTNYNESESSYGYIAVVNTGSYFFSLWYHTYYYHYVSPEIREEIIDFNKDVFYDILESTKFSNSP